MTDRPLRCIVLALIAILLPVGCQGDVEASRGTEERATSVIRYGPFAVEPDAAGTAHLHHEGGSGFGDVLLDVEKPCEDCWITGFRPSLAAPDGTPLDPSGAIMLHHFVLADGLPSCGTVARPDPRFFAAGAELSVGTLPRGYGYRVDDGDRWGAVVELMNAGNAARLVYVDVAFEHTTEPQRDVVPLWFDAGGCPSSGYSIPADRSVRDRTFRLGVGGRIVAAVGHLHPGGVVVSAVDETTGELICDSRPIGSPTHVRGMSVCRGDPLAVVHRGDRVRIRSVYDAPRTTSGVMGIVVAYVAAGGN